MGRSAELTQEEAHIFTVGFCEPFLSRLVEHLRERYLKDSNDLSRIAIVFGGKRPSLFLTRALAQQHGKPFIPPHFFTIDEWIRHVVWQKQHFAQAPDLDQSYLIYKLSQDLAPEILKGRKTFAQFLPWARQILSFIDLLDLENVADRDLKNVQANARIGYAVPSDINRLLEHVVALRQAYHAWMRENQTYSRGFQYQQSAQWIESASLDAYDQILFCNFFYLHRTEEVVIKNLYDRKKAALFFQGDERRWPILSKLAQNLGCSIREGDPISSPPFELKLYSAFDGHSQVAQVREIVKNLSSQAKPDGTSALKNTVIVLPDPEQIIPLLSEVSGILEDFNVSMGYPLKRSSLYSLFEMIFASQLSRQEQKYYSRDYLRTLRHPLVKSLGSLQGSSATRVLIHKIEEILTGQVMTELSGSIFVDLKALENLDDLYKLTLETLSSMNVQMSKEDLQKIFKEIHQKLFHSWEEVLNFSEFANALESFLNFFLEKSSLKYYPLNLKIVARMLAVQQELATVSFDQEQFSSEEIFRIFNSKIEQEIVAFSGSPLKGLQILGLLETRSLNFEHVIILDVNENV
ncbi:MAG: hypothetical protein NUV91_10120, partial [Candidatus Omnitrophica bacterium]|nr:hypothetical protein [Candidatus Omnitrophota bacterium]